ncbi:MAG: hypothetical protein CL675_02765 [Bdellovibrionaceae bacterium]|nr:hypothetical protein [Pseudobdellovibrionaceae bacterium]
MRVIPLPLRGGSGKNQSIKGYQIKYKELDGLSFINPSVGHDMIVESQNRDLDRVAQWLKDFPHGIKLD